MVYVDGGRPVFAIIPNLKYYQDFNETILETLNIPEKVLAMLLNISGNVYCASRLRSAVNFEVRILLILFAQVINKHLKMNASINSELLTEMLLRFKILDIYPANNFT